MPSVLIRACIACYGHRRFAERLRAQGVPFAIAHSLIFGRPARPI